jgi:hypothetical protein
MWQSTNLAVEVRLTFDVIAVLHRIDSEDAAPLIGEAKPPLQPLEYVACELLPEASEFPSAMSDKHLQSERDSFGGQGLGIQYAGRPRRTAAGPSEIGGERDGRLRLGACRTMQLRNALYSLLSLGLLSRYVVP